LGKTPGPEAGDRSGAAGALHPTAASLGTPLSQWPRPPPPQINNSSRKAQRARCAGQNMKMTMPYTEPSMRNPTADGNPHYHQRRKKTKE